MLQGRPRPSPHPIAFCFLQEPPPCVRDRAPAGIRKSERQPLRVRPLESQRFCSCRLRLPPPYPRPAGQECANWARWTLLAARAPVDFERGLGGAGGGAACGAGGARRWGVSLPPPRSHCRAPPQARRLGLHHEAAPPMLGPAAARDSPQPRPLARSRYAPPCPAAPCLRLPAAVGWGRPLSVWA